MKNYLELININSKQIEEQIITFDYKKNYIRLIDTYVENFQFIPFMYSFYNFVLINQTIPSKEEFAKNYIRNNWQFLKTCFIKNNNYKYYLECLISRLYRSYPSFIRDLHFAKYIQDNSNLTVFYNTDLDVKQGIDLLINSIFAIHLFIETNRSNNFRKIKNNRHNIDSYKHIDISLNLDKGFKCGDFILYNKQNLDNLIYNINNYN